MGQGIPSGEHPTCAGERSRFLRGRAEPRPTHERRRIPRTPTAEVRAFVVNPDPPRLKEDATIRSKARLLTEERDRALNALEEMERHLKQLQGKVAVTQEERDWARHNLRVLDEEVITLRARVTDQTDEVNRLQEENSRAEPLPPEGPADSEDEAETLSWDERSDLSLEMSRLQDDLKAMTEQRDRALKARDALAQQILMATAGARRDRQGFWAKNAVNLLVCLFLLVGMAMMGHFFPRIVIALSGQPDVAGRVEVRREPMEVKITAPHPRE